MHDIHDPYDPNSPAYDLQQGSLETMQMLEPVVIIVAGSADLPDNPNDLLEAGQVSEEMQWAAAEHCSDPEHDAREDDARESGHL